MLVGTLKKLTHMLRVVFEAEASEGEVRQVVSPPFPFPVPSQIGRASCRERV